MDFEVLGLMGQDIDIKPHICKKDGTLLPCAGDVPCHTLRPEDQKSRYPTYRVFVPYGRLNLPVGRHEFTCVMTIYKHEESRALRELTRSSSRSWLITVEPVNAAAGIEGTPHAVVVEPVLRGRGEAGIVISATCSVSGMENWLGWVGAVFMREDGSALRDLDDEFGTTDGQSQVAVGQSFRPNDKEIRWDVTLFIPCTQLHLPAGAHKLRCIVKIWRQAAQGHAWIELARREAAPFEVSIPAG